MAAGLCPGRALLSRRGGALWALLGTARGRAAGPETHFGFQNVSEAERREKIYQVFENVAEKYDVMNDSMSLGIHRVWKDILVHKMNPSPGTLLVDVAGGTGDIAFRFLNYVRSVRERQLQQKLRHHQNLSWQEISKSYQEEKSNPLGDSQVVVCDINKEMLKAGKQKAQHLGYSEVVAVHAEKKHECFTIADANRSGLSWVLGNAEELPFDDDKFDVYTIAFGIRNVTRIDLEHVTTLAKLLPWKVQRLDPNHIEKYAFELTLTQALQEAYRVLKPGGRFLCLEFSHVSNPLLSRLYDLYSFQVIPVLGEVIAGDWKSYQYLVESIRRFPPQEELKAMIEDAGFLKVDYQNLNSGIVAIHSGFKL